MFYRRNITLSGFFDVGTLVLPQSIFNISEENKIGKLEEADRSYFKGTVRMSAGQSQNLACIIFQGLCLALSK